MYKFLTGDYAATVTIDPPSSVSIYRGYSFRVTTPIVIHGFHAGVERFASVSADRQGGHMSIYKGLENGTPLSILRSVNMDVLGHRFWPINPIALIPGEWYIIAAGGKLGTSLNNNSLSAVGYWDVSAMVENELFLDSWMPATGGSMYQMYVWTNPESQGPPSGILGRTPLSGAGSVSDARPNIGFEYTFDSLIRVFVNEDEVIFPDAKPFFDMSGRIMIPARFVFDLMGATTTWWPSLQTAEVVRGTTRLYFVVGSSEVIIQGRDNYPLTYPIELHDDRIVLWDQDIAEFFEDYIQEETEIIDLFHHVKYKTGFGNIWTNQNAEWPAVPDVWVKRADSYVKITDVWTMQGTNWRDVT